MPVPGTHQQNVPPTPALSLINKLSCEKTGIGYIAA
jgi:hypothetical protein